MGELQPRMRAGDKDRQRVVEQLGKHFGEGRLTVPEFDERVVRAHASVYLDELPALTADLPRDPEPQRHPTRSAGASALRGVRAPPRVAARLVDGGGRRLRRPAVVRPLPPVPVPPAQAVEPALVSAPWR